MRKGEITAFLSLVFVLLVSFILGIMEVSVIQTSKNMARLEADRAVYSVFGEYQRELLEQYHVFAVDGSYGTGQWEEENLVRRMHYFGTENVDHKITGIQLMTDNSGQAFREQVLDYMEQRYGIALIQDFTGLTAEWEAQEIAGEEFKEKEKELAGQIQDVIGNSENSAELEESGENPFACVQQIEKSGLLSVVTPKEMEISGKQIDRNSQVSYRKLEKGRGIFPARKGTDGIEEKLLFNEYILDTFKNAAFSSEEQSTSEEDTSLEYEVEYILSGQESDKENLEEVLQKIFLIRMVLNYTYLLGDSAKQSEAEALALTVSTILLMPEASEVVKQLILVAWACGESAVDIRTLLSGKRAALIKNSESWQVPLSSLLTVASGGDGMEGSDTAGGITYKDYLRILLFLGDSEEITMRTLDRTEENLNAIQEMEFFQADQCVTKIEIESTVQLYGNLTYQFPVYFGYD